MIRTDRLFLMACMLCVLASHRVLGQDAPEEDSAKRVQYQLVLPEEKTPENVKPEEHNPFESESEAQSRLSPGDTEENRVRDKLLRLPVVGVKRMEDNRMRVLLGNIILETGGVVPPVLPEQLVELRVKNITSHYIELAWQEKRTTGLPPKLMIIPINLSPKVRYQMLGQLDEQGKSGAVTATMDLPLRDLTPGRQQPPSSTAAANQPAPPRAEFVPDDSPVAPEPARETASKEPAAQRPAQGLAQEQPAATNPPAATRSAAAPAVESVVRMLFGTPAPAPK